MISAVAQSEIDRWIEKYPEDQKQSAVMAALRIVQDENGGHLTLELMDAVADYLQMPLIQVYEVATFYSMYEHKPVGKHKLCVCTNISCMLRNSKQVVEHLQQRLGIDFGEVTEDGLFSLKEVECLGACVNAPVMQVGENYYEHLDPAKIDALLEQLRSEG